MPLVSEDREVAYRVEVSGWDNAEEFFVEKTDLKWTEASGKQVLLSREVNRGALLFLRLLHPTNLARVRPVAYQADPVTNSDTTRGQHLVRLVQANPRNRQD